MYLRQELLYASAFMFLNVGSHYKRTLGGMTSSILTLVSPLSDQLACEGSYRIPKKTSPQAKRHKLSFLFTSLTISTSLTFITR